MTATDRPLGVAEYLSLIDPANRANPYPLLAELRALGPLRLGTAPVVLFTNYDDCLSVLRHPDARVDRGLTEFPLSQFPDPRSDARGEKPSFLFLDPPDHTRLRRLVAQAFTPRTVRQLAPRITELVDRTLDRAAAAGQFDAVADLAYPLPVTVICELLGVPVADGDRLSEWSALMSRRLDPAARSTAAFAADPTELARASDEMYSYFEDLAARRRTDPGPDLLSQLIAAEESGDKLTHDELIGTCGLLLIAGHETTVNLIGNAILALLRDPRHLAALRADPDLAPAIVEETLRYDPPVQLAPRIAAADMRIAGMDIRRGDLLIMLFAAAQRDPQLYPDPDRFDPGRDARHLAFGLGAHFCLGAPLARLEAAIALSRFAARVERPRLLVDPPPYRDHVNLRGPAALPIAFDAI
ncbi:cytochrome P450 [Nocardia panacis]|uniref:Cytochrome P450 n=1 Tax=Nocardia panacis TaxID=2340916 RepID=A0A3A4JXQ2_9NOCA|nr:cytochrome P450 [Nocardia panacis]RJO69040.1 cytochrome P450 [Nocardia panacis]